MGRKKTEGDFRQVGFRMPRATFDVLAQVAEARGIDLSALLNQIISDALPDLRLWLIDHESKGLEAMRRGLRQGNDPALMIAIEERMLQELGEAGTTARKLLMDVLDRPPAERDAALAEASALPEGERIVATVRQILHAHEFASWVRSLPETAEE
jgi:hypothetical protein